jgi:hypothetical protein
MQQIVRTFKDLREGLFPQLLSKKIFGFRVGTRMVAVRRGGCGYYFA